MRIPVSCSGMLLPGGWCLEELVQLLGVIRKNFREETCQMQKTFLSVERCCHECNSVKSNKINSCKERNMPI